MRFQALARVIKAYGGKCVCCGEKNILFLTIDHSKNNGAEHRRSLKIKAGTNFYYWLWRNRYPKNLGLRVLCYNCNCGRRRNNDKCPHST